jgi:hypothetical protein
LTTKIIFSDGNVRFLKSEDQKMCDQLKEAQNDKGVNTLLNMYAGQFEYCDENTSSDVQCTVDLHKKKQSIVKRMKKAFGGR